MAEIDLDSSYLTPGQIEALRAPKGFGRRAKVAQALVGLLISLNADPDKIREAVSSLNDMSKRELKRFHHGLEDFERSMGKAGLADISDNPQEVEGVVPVPADELAETSEYLEPVISPELASEMDVPEEAGIETDHGVTELTGEEKAPVFTASATVKRLVRDILGEEITHYDGVVAGRLIKAIELSGFVGATRNRPSGDRIDSRRRLQLFFENNGSLGVVAELEGKGSSSEAVAQWFSQIRKRARLARGEDTSKQGPITVEETPNTTATEQAAETPIAKERVEKNQEYYRIADDWAAHLKLESDLKSALQELLNPNGSADVSPNKKLVAEQFRQLLVGEDGKMVRFRNIDQRDLARIWQLFGLGINTQNGKALMRNIDPLGRRVRSAQMHGNPVAAQEMIDHTYDGMRGLLKSITQENTVMEATSRAFRVHIVDGVPVLRR